MKRTKFRLAILLVSLLPMIYGCSQEFMPDEEFGLRLERVENTNQNELSIKFTPSKNAEYVELYFGVEISKEDFVEEAQGFERVDGNKEFTHTFSSLVEDKIYTLYARSFVDSKYTEIVEYIYFNENLQSPEVMHLFNLPASQSFVFQYDDKFIQYRYYLGGKQEKDSFADKTIVGTVLDANFFEMGMQINLFNEEFDGKVFYYAAVDRYGKESEVREIHITTPDEASAPSVTLREGNSDIMTTRYVLEKNKNTSKMIAVLSLAGTFDSVIDSPTGFSGQRHMWLYGNSQFDWSGVYTTTESTLELSYVDYTFTLGLAYELYINLYDNDGKLVGMQKFNVNKHGRVEGAPNASVEIEVSDITSTNATCTFRPDSNTDLFFFEIVDADWYDNAYDAETTLRNEILMAYQYMGRKELLQYPDELEGGVYEYTETELESGKRYYAAACPLNVNGWCPTIFVEFTAL